MEKFITVLQMSGNKEKLNNLRVLEESHRFDNFPPFWYELGSAYQNDNNYSAARKAYTKFEQLQNNTIITYDKYYVELAKNMISLIAGGGSTEAKNKQLRVFNLKTEIQQLSLEKNYATANLNLKMIKPCKRKRKKRQRKKDMHRNKSTLST